MTLRAWHLALIALVAFVGLRFGWGEPRFISADEADTVQGGVDLVQAMTNEDFEGGLSARLKAGFATNEGNPRLDDFPPDQGYRRAVLEAPVPRWLAALGVGVLAGDSTPNLARAANASALAVTLALVLLMRTGAASRHTSRAPMACREVRVSRKGSRSHSQLMWLGRRAGVMALAAPLMLVCLPGVLDAAVSGGYGAAAMVVMALVCVSVERLVDQRRGALFVGVACGLAFGVHPMAIALVVAVFVAFAIRRSSSSSVEDDGFRLPAAPLSLFAVPIVTLVVLVLAWPALWSETGKRLGAWILDYGFYFNAPHEVADQVYHQHIDRAAPAWTALLQWAAWTPVPVVLLWLAGVARAARDGRAGHWFPIVAWLALLLCGGMDGGLFGARWSLLPLMWVPTALTAADGLRASFEWLGRWPRARWLLVVPVVLALVQAARVTTWGAATQTGSELRYAVSLALLDDVEEADPGGVVALMQGPIGEYLPQLEAARIHLERDVRIGEAQNAGWIVVIGEKKPESDRQLEGFSEVRRDSRGGLPMSLWRRAPR